MTTPHMQMSGQQNVGFKTYYLNPVGSFIHFITHAWITNLNSSVYIGHIEGQAPQDYCNQTITE